MSKPSDTQWGSGYNYSQVGFPPKPRIFNAVLLWFFPYMSRNRMPH